MARVKNHYHDEICSRKPADDRDACVVCGNAPPNAAGKCLDCIERQIDAMKRPE